MTSVEISPRPYDDPDVVRLVAEVQAYYVEVYGSPDEAVLVDAELRPPHGELLVVTLDGQAVAMGGWRRQSDHATAEVKRMYVTPAARRHGLARRLLDAVERSAAASGVERLVLNTGPHQHAAIALYEAEGYTPSEPFGYYAEHGEAIFLAKQLT